MNDKVATIIEKILYIPHDFHSIHTKSWNTLLQESGYFEVHEQVNENEIIEILKNHSHLIVEWLRWSDDQRCSSIWYFTKGEDGKCFVGHYPEGKEFEEGVTHILVETIFDQDAFMKHSSEKNRSPMVSSLFLHCKLQDLLPHVYV